MIQFRKRHKEIAKHLCMHALVIGLLTVWIIGINRVSDLYVQDVIVKVDKIEGIKDLITSEEVKNYILKELPNDILNQKINSLDLNEMEELLSSDTRIYKVEVYIDALQKLVVDIIQRRPVLRVINHHGDQYYIDQAGHYVRRGDYRAIRVPVATGYIESYSKNITLDKAPKLQMAFEIAQAIRIDELLHALIEQIHIDKDGIVTLIPKVGQEKIILKHMDELDTKLNQLKIFYKELARTDGWGKYDEIDISYKNVVYGRNSEHP